MFYRFNILQILTILDILEILDSRDTSSHFSFLLLKAETFILRLNRLSKSQSRSVFLTILYSFTMKHPNERGV